MPKIGLSEMNVLKQHLGCDVAITRNELGVTYTHRQKLHRIDYFGRINDLPLIGMNSAILAVRDIASGRILLENPAIPSNLRWNSSRIMWQLRFRSYGWKRALRWMAGFHPSTVECAARI